jgi:hypothetical protein
MTMTSRELAIARTVIYASLFDYPLRLDQLHYALIESEQSPSEILGVYDGSEALQELLEYRDGFFFPAGRADLVGERIRREARSRDFLERHARVLRVLCALPYTRLVALSGSIAHLNLESNGDLDLFVITKGQRVWTVTVTMLLVAKLFNRRRTVCTNFVLADSHLGLEQQDLFSANQVINLRPLIGARTLTTFVAANTFVARMYPNATHLLGAPMTIGIGRGMSTVKKVLELVLSVPSPLIEVICRRLYAWHLRRRAGSWRSPDQVSLRADYLKLHTQSHRRSVMARFEAAMDAALAGVSAESTPIAAVGGVRTRRVRSARS